jgi:CRISPR-associated protein Cas1
VRVMALHALAYCERLFYLEEVEELRIADERVFKGRQLHASLEAGDDGEETSLDLASEALGLYGKVDCLKRRDGSYLPYEHKRGKPAKDRYDDPAAWPSDRLQIIAYALLLEEAFGQPIEEGRVRYHAAKVTVKVPIDDFARTLFDSAMYRAQQLRETLERPPITENARLCEMCSLAPVCLPEEVRAEREPERDVKRLFPPDRDGTVLHIVSQGASIGVSQDSLVIRPQGEPEFKRPARDLDALLLHGSVQITTQAIRKCLEHGIGVHWLGSTGHHYGSLVAGAGHVQRRIRQYKALTDDATCTRLAKALAQAKCDGQYRYLMRASRGDDDARADIQKSLDGIQPLLAQISVAADRDTLRGLEGSVAVNYFAALRKLLGRQVHVDLHSTNRSRRPPLDRFNALLSFGYGLVHTAVLRAVLASGLEPAFGFFHTPRSAAFPLVLDLMELFRVLLWDMPMIGSLNRGQWDPLEDFEVTKTKVWLSDPGRKKAIGLFESRLQETWKHPVLDYSLSYARTIELEARLLEKEWTGEPGLFAQSRLR